MSAEVRLRAQAAATGRAQGLLLLLITIFCWGLNWPALKLVLADLPPFSARTASALVAGIVVMGLAALRAERLLPPPGQWPRLILASLLNYTSWLGFVALALVWLPASTAVIITYTMPIWAACLAWPMLGERPGVRHVLGLCLGVGGVFTILGGGAATIGPHELPGAAAALGAAVLFALGSVFTKRAPVNLPPFALVGWQILIGVAPILVLALLFEHPDFATLPRLDWLALCYTAFIGLVLGYLCWFRALRMLPASVATGTTLLVPVVGVFSSGLLLGEPLGVRQFLALGLTLSGVVVTSRA